MSVELNEALFAKLAGWEVVKQARSLVASGQVVRADWQAPHLRGMIREGGSTFQTGLLIRSASDADNLCPCRASRQRGVICAHAVAVGIFHLRSTTAPLPAPSLLKKEAKPAPTSAPASRPPGRALRRSADGAELELHLILPPNLSDALARGQLMLFLEGATPGRRGPLNSFPLDRPFALSPADTAILDALETLNEGDTPAMMRLTAQQWATLLPLLVGHERITVGRQQSMEVKGEPWVVAVRATLESNGEITLALQGTAPRGCIQGPRLWLLAGNCFRPLGLPAGWESLLQAPLRLSRERVPAFLQDDWPALSAGQSLEANFQAEDFSLEPGVPRFELQLAGGLAMLQGRLECFYGDRKASELAPESSWFPAPDSPRRYWARQPEQERAALARLLRAGFTAADAQGWHHLQGQEAVLRFFAKEYPVWQKLWTVSLEERLEKSTRNNLERIEPRFRVQASGEQWFDLQIGYETSGGERLTGADIQRLLRSGQSHTRLANGKYALLDTGAVEELQEVLRDCAPQQHGGGYRMGQAQAGFLAATIGQQERWRLEAPPAWTQRVAQQRGEVRTAPPPLGDLETVLRPYQKEGVAWLRFLRNNGFGGILADDMGLGKTLQVLAHLAVLRAEVATVPKTPALVVCPTSLVSNWAAEAARFTPGLRVLVLHGPQRHDRFARIPEHDLVVTSYALLRRDAAQYQGREFDTVILDEAQHIKNRQTQNAQAVKAIQAAHRLVLTGTPLENSVLDLWSIFDFLMPGYLGAANDFRERYEIPLVRDQDAGVRQRLARRLRPFLLRRLKREVAADLPARLEQVSYCELSEDQRAVYQQVLEASRRELVNATEPGGLARSRMVVLTALLRLRQICCDLRLLPAAGASAEAAGGDVVEPRAPALSSGKLELFGELLEQVLDGGHRVLVFSQFTRMLGLLREDLAQRGIDYCYLDGSTEDRAAVVDRFQRDGAIPVFLISLKAGGVGLNLTGADTVVHFDPWWNPAVEAQATDRAHRIGQSQVVTSYKLITRGTVEEKILNLQARKRGLVEGLLGDEEQLAASLTWEEIQDLLAG